MELVARIGALLFFGVLSLRLLSRPDDPDLDEETAGLIAGNLPRIANHLNGEDT